MSEERSWKTPAAILGIIGALIAIGGLYYQHRQSVMEKERQVYQQTIDQENANKKNEEDKQKQARLTTLNNELKDVETQIQKNNADLKRAQDACDMYGNKLQNPDLDDPTKAAFQQSLANATDFLQRCQKLNNDLQGKKTNLDKEINDLVNK